VGIYSLAYDGIISPGRAAVTLIDVGIIRIYNNENLKAKGIYIQTYIKRAFFPKILSECGPSSFSTTGVSRFSPSKLIIVYRLS
jgi:hypothetical protein